MKFRESRVFRQKRIDIAEKRVYDSNNELKNCIKKGKRKCY